MRRSLTWRSSSSSSSKNGATTSGFPSQRPLCRTLGSGRETQICAEKMVQFLNTILVSNMKHLSLLIIRRTGEGIDWRTMNTRPAIWGGIFNFSLQGEEPKFSFKWELDCPLRKKFKVCKKSKVFGLIHGGVYSFWSYKSIEEFQAPQLSIVNCLHAPQLSFKGVYSFTGTSIVFRGVYRHLNCQLSIFYLNCL